MYVQLPDYQKCCVPCYSTLYIGGGGGGGGGGADTYLSLMLVLFVFVFFVCFFWCFFLKAKSPPEHTLLTGSIARYWHTVQVCKPYMYEADN